MHGGDFLSGAPACLYFLRGLAGEWRMSKHDAVTDEGGTDLHVSAGRRRRYLVGILAAWRQALSTATTGAAVTARTRAALSARLQGPARTVDTVAAQGLAAACAALSLPARGGVSMMASGSGKTTAAVHLAVAAAQQGRNVAVLDTDPQQSASRWGGRRSVYGRPGRCEGLRHANKTAPAPARLLKRRRPCRRPAARRVWPRPAAGGALLERVLDLERRATALLDAAEADPSRVQVALSAMREVRACIELLARVAGTFPPARVPAEVEL